MFLTVVVACLAAVLVAGAAGCTVVEACGLGQQEYCTEDGECTCGRECKDSSKCEDEDKKCLRYRYNPTHGVCVGQDFLDQNNITLQSSDAGVDGGETGN